MTSRRKSLLGAILKSLIIPGTITILVGVFVVYSLMKNEYDEILDIGLTSKANLLLKIAETAAEANSASNTLDLSALLSFEEEAIDQDERTIYWLLDSSGNVMDRSPLADAELMPEPPQVGLSTLNGNRIAVLRAEHGLGMTVIVAEPMHERNEAIRDVVLGVLVSFLLLGLLFAAAAFLAVRRSVHIIAALSDNIADKNEHNLSSIDRNNSFAEFEPAIETLDKLLERLDTALEAERAFATNAAHELRTPVAICLAQVQRLKAMSHDPAKSNNVHEIELALKRLVRLIERLLEMSRAQSGLGSAAIEADSNQVISLMLRELRNREPSDKKLVLQYPTGTWPSHVDPDALGIILNNLFDNMLKYASGERPSVVDASRPGRVVISNDCDPLEPQDLEEIKRRFVRKASISAGYGLGLSIVKDLCNQAGCQFEIFSPQPDKSRGFTAVLTIPSKNR